MEFKRDNKSGLFLPNRELQRLRKPSLLMNTNLCGFMAGGSDQLKITLDGSLGDNVAASTQTYTVAGNIPAGAVVVIATALDSIGSDVSSITDSVGGNTWTVDQNGSGIAGTNTIIGIQSAYLTNALPAGSTIVVHWNSSGTGHVIIVAWYNWGQTTPFNVEAHTSGTSTTPSTTTTATSQANEVIFGVLGLGSTSPSITEDSNFVALTSTTFKVSYVAHMAYRVVSATGAQTYAPTLSSSTGWRAVCGCYKYAAP